MFNKFWGAMAPQATPMQANMKRLRIAYIQCLYRNVHYILRNSDM